MLLPQNCGSYTPPPQGPHVAVCVAFIDQGTQKSVFQGAEKRRHIVTLRWALADEVRDDGRPHTVSRSYTWSMNEKASLRKDLEAWRGKPFQNTDLGPDGFDVRKLLGVPCFINIVHETAANGTTYASIASIMPLPKTVPKPNPSLCEHIYVALTKDRFDEAAFKKLPEKTQAAIMTSPEYQMLFSPATAAGPLPDAGAADEVRDEEDFVL